MVCASACVGFYFDYARLLLGSIFRIDLIWDLREKNKNLLRKLVFSFSASIPTFACEEWRMKGFSMGILILVSFGV